MTTQWFKVSADWMKTCGLGDKATVFPVIRAEPNFCHDKFFSCMVTVDRNGHPWVVAIGRGEFVSSK